MLPVGVALVAWALSVSLPAEPLSPPVILVLNLRPRPQPHWPRVRRRSDERAETGGVSAAQRVGEGPPGQSGCSASRSVSRATRSVALGPAQAGAWTASSAQSQASLVASFAAV